MDNVSRNKITGVNGFNHQSPLVNLISETIMKSGFLTCEATVRFRATPPAFKLIRKILQSGSLVNFEIAASLAAMDMDPTN